MVSRSILWVPDEEGMPTPVLDLTHPAFAIEIDDAEVARLADDFVRDAVPAPQLSPATRMALHRSRLGRAVLASSGTYLSGMGTYLLKLGPDAFDPDVDPLDRRLAASFPAFCTRIRLQDTVRLMVDELARQLDADEQRPVSFINIGGGPAADTVNTLLAIQARDPALLSSRRIDILVLDVDERGPAFGARVIDALQRPGRPLWNIVVSFTAMKCDWRDQDVAALVRAVVEHGAFAVVSSEGGVFEYGDDDTVIANLESVHAATAEDAIVVGSVTRQGKTLDALGPTRAAVRPRSIDAFAALTTRTGWEINEVIERPLCYVVRMSKANMVRPFHAPAVMECRGVESPRDV